MLHQLIFRTVILLLQEFAVRNFGAFQNSALNAILLVDISCASVKVPVHARYGVQTGDALLHGVVAPEQLTHCVDLRWSTVIETWLTKVLIAFDQRYYIVLHELLKY